MSIAFKSLAAIAAILMSCASASSQGAGGVGRLQTAAAASGPEAARVARELANASSGLSENELRQQCRQMFQIIQNAPPEVADAINQAILESENRRLAVCLEELAGIAPAAINSPLDNDTEPQGDVDSFNSNGSSS